MKDGGDGYTKGEARASLSYIDVPRLSDERAGSAGTYFTGFPWLSTTTRSPRPSERTPANCVLASPTMTIVIPVEIDILPDHLFGLVESHILKRLLVALDVIVGKP